MLFDVQVKRIHEYKRQLLNVLHVIHLYERISAGDATTEPPRAVIIGGKAAPGYVMAKTIVKLANEGRERHQCRSGWTGAAGWCSARTTTSRPWRSICPAADLSEQISTAGKEASGTGNMKFMMNGAVTIGTLDGANIEIREAVGDENFFLFGLTVDEIEALRPQYDPQSVIAADPEFAALIELLESGHFDCLEHHVLDAVLNSIRSPGDQWMTAADFRSCVDANQRAALAYRDIPRWTRMSILNTAASGRFSTDRTMQEYNRDIWRLTPITP